MLQGRALPPPLPPAPAAAPEEGAEEAGEQAEAAEAPEPPKIEISDADLLQVCCVPLASIMQSHLRYNARVSGSRTSSRNDSWPNMSQPWHVPPALELQHYYKHC